MFDKVEIVVEAGDGGDGAISFRREKYVPFAGPDGGDGGTGGDVVIIADSSVTDLRMFKRKRLYKAVDGEDGKGKNKHGKQGKDLILRVPMGTIALDKSLLSDKGLIADLEHVGQQAVLVKGGKGGLGNTKFASSINQAPRLAQKGRLGKRIP